LTNSDPIGCGQKDFNNDVLNDVTCPSVTLVAIMDVNKVKGKVKCTSGLMVRQACMAKCPVTYAPTFDGHYPKKNATGRNHLNHKIFIYGTSICI
jgi:hypothetical protein